MFSIGDKIAHHMHGAGVINSIIQREIDGKKRNYFQVDMVAGTMTVLIPCSSSVAGIRPVIELAEIDGVLECLTQQQDPDTLNWNKRYRENMIKIKSGDLIQVAGVIKALNVREHDRGLSTGERKLLSSARQIVVSEISLVRQIGYKEAETIVDARLA